MSDDFTQHLIFVDSGDLAVQADETWSALTDWSSHHDPPRVLVKDGVLARVTERSLELYDKYSLRDEASRSARFLTMTARGVPNPRYPPVEVMDTLLRRDPREYGGARQIVAVVDVPVVSQTGELVFEPGLHSSGLYYSPDEGLRDVEVGAVESVDDVVDARDFLMDELLGDFDWANEASKANALGLVLLPFLRHFVGDYPTPMYAVTASQPGSGKTFLVQACLIPGCGLVGFAPEPHNDEELRKLITSGLLAGRPAVVFDNISDEVASGTLASALTARVWQDRILGQSKEVSLPIRCIWASTGNWVTGTPEIVDRFCPIKLEARGVPARKKPAGAFRHPDLHGWALQNRPKLVAACLTLIAHWFKGAARLSPDGTLLRDEHRHAAEATLGSFERWAEVIGGVLAAADVHGFLDNLEEARAEMDVEGGETSDFLSELRSIVRDEAFSPGAVAQLCAFGGPLHEYLPSSIDGRDVQRSLKRWLTHHKGQVHDGLTLTPVGARPPRWIVQRLDEMC